jgi:hypothetical protein
VDYLLWWARRGSIPEPLVTTASAGGLGSLAEPDTVVLFGGGSTVGRAMFSGFRVFAGLPLGDGPWMLEGNYFFLGERGTGFTAASNAAGDPRIARPFINELTGNEISLSSAVPGAIAGSINVNSSSRLFGWEINLARSSSNRNVDWLVGFRALDLRDVTAIHENFAPIGFGAVPFGGGVFGPGSVVNTFDNFTATSRFWGPQIGARAVWRSGRYSLDIVGKLAIGASDMRVDIDGSSTLTNAAGQTTLPGGVLAVGTNIGSHSSTRFAIVPEVGINLGVKLTDRLSARVGYNFLYLSQVARSGEQFDRTVADTLIPTGVFFGPTGTETRPRGQVNATDYWAQGLNFGLLFTY